MKKTRHRRFAKRRKDEQKPFFSDKENLSADTKSDRSFFQPKLEIGDPADVSEKEADKMADHVINHSNHNSSPKTPFGNNSVQRQEKEEEPAAKHIQRQAEKEEEPAAKLIQRQTEEEEEPAAKKIQPQMEEEEPAAKQIQKQAEKEEEPAAKLLQSQAEEEEEPAAKRIQRQPGEEEPVQAKLNPGHSGSSSEIQNTKVQAKSKQQDSGILLEEMIRETKGMGMALPDDIRAEMEETIKADFSQVRIHIGEKAIEMTNMINAQAFTHGYDIYFNAGKYQPYSTEGKHLLAHELTHVKQQKG